MLREIEIQDAPKDSATIYNPRFKKMTLPEIELNADLEDYRKHGYNRFHFCRSTCTIFCIKESELIIPGESQVNVFMQFINKLNNL